MKTCPQCKSVYTDESLLFCLTDGTPLVPSSAEEEDDEAAQTVRFPESIATEPVFRAPVSGQDEVRRTSPVVSEPARRGVSPVWVGLTIFLLLLLLIGVAGVGWYIYSVQDTFGNAAPTQNLPTNNSPARNEKGTGDMNVASPSPSPSPNQTRTPGRTVTPLPTDSPGPATYRVVGIRSDDVLYIRPAPNDLKTFLGRIPPGARGIVVTGPGKRAGSGIWYPINYQGTRGWVHGRYITKE